MRAARDRQAARRLRARSSRRSSTSFTTSIRRARHGSPPRSENGRFTVATDQPHVKVAWRITGHQRIDDRRRRSNEDGSSQAVHPGPGIQYVPGWQPRGTGDDGG